MYVWSAYVYYIKEHALCTYDTLPLREVRMPRQYPFPSLHVLNSLLLGSTHEGPQEQCSTPWSSSCAASQPASPLQASSELDQGSVLGQCGDDSPPFQTQPLPQIAFQVIIMSCFVISITEEDPWIGVKCIVYISHCMCALQDNYLTIPLYQLHSFRSQGSLSVTKLFCD